MNNAEWLPRFDVMTDYRDILQRPSDFNPYPELAADGIEIWSWLGGVWDGGRYTDKDFAACIRYLASGEMCYVQIPQTGHEAPPEKLPMLLPKEHSGGRLYVNDLSLGKWAPFPEYWRTFSVKLIDDYCAEHEPKELLYDSVLEFTVPAKEASATTDDQKLLIVEPVQALKRLLGVAKDLAEDGQWREAVGILENRCTDDCLSVPGRPTISMEPVVDVVYKSSGGLALAIFEEHANWYDSKGRAGYAERCFAVGGSALVLAHYELRKLAFGGALEDKSMERPLYTKVSAAFADALDRRPTLTERLVGELTAFEKLSGQHVYEPEQRVLSFFGL